MSKKSRKEYQHQYYLKRKAENAKNAEVLQKQKPIFGKPSVGSSNGSYFNFAGPLKAGQGITEQTVINQFKSWIFTCSSYNGSAVASANLRLYAVSDKNDSKKFLHKTVEKDATFLNYIKSKSSVKSLAKVKSAENVVEVVNHPLLDLLQNINNYNNYFETMETTSIFLDLVGNSYWYVVRNSLGIPQSIWLLKSQNVKIVPGTRELVKGYLYDVSGNGFSGGSPDLIKFMPKEIIHFKTPNPNSIYYGKGCAQSVVGAINRFNMMDESESARLKNMGRPDFAVKYKNGKIDSSEIKKIERMWNSAFGGPNKAGKIKVMDEDWDIETLGFSPKDMEYLSGRVWSLKEISAAFGIPYSILDTSDVKKATSELSEYWYAKNAILPRITRIEEKLNEKLLPLYDTSGRMFLMYDNPVPRDQAQLTEENSIYIDSGVKTINEVRLSLQLPKYDDPLFDEPFAKGKSFTDAISGQGLPDGSPPKVPGEENPKKPGKPGNPEKAPKKPGRPRNPEKLEE